MSKRKPFLRLFTERGPLTVLAVAGAMMLGIVAPASAQFFDFGFGGFGRRPAPQQQQRGGGGGFFSPFGDAFGPGPSQQQQAPRPQDFSRAPPAAKRDAPADRNVLVLGDAMADWLAYGLEDALSETPELGVIRRHKTVSGLIKYQPKGEPSDWAAASKGILATEKPDVIVVMLGLNDRVPIREPEKKAAAPGVDKKGAKKPDDKAADTTADGKPADNKTTENKPADAKPGDAKPAENEVAPDDDDQPSLVAPEKSARSGGGGSYDFRDDRWVELYSKKIEEMIAVLKTKGVPILWVGLPAIRGPKATSDMLFLDALYRDVAGKAGITYVDVWDGFVDDAGRFAQQGPDFEGQIRRLRSSDGVFFTKAGARKLAHYTEREIRRVLGSLTAPVEIPTEPEANVAPSVTPDPTGKPPRPLVGPIVPLVAASVGGDELLGGTGARPTSADPLASKTMVKGEPLSAPAGRADDFSWPRREVGSLSAPAGDPAVAAAPSDGSAAAAQKPKPVKRPASQPVAQGFYDAGGPAQAGSGPRQQRVSRDAPRPQQGGVSSFFPWFSR